jgi:hypothetical protein
MEMLADISSVNSKKQLEYLFYGVDPNVPSELEHVIEEGFRSSEEAKKLGICPFVPLFNTILGVDLPRITHHIEVQQKNNKLGKSKINFIQILFRRETWATSPCCQQAQSLFAKS